MIHEIQSGKEDLAPNVHCCRSYVPHGLYIVARLKFARGEAKRPWAESRPSACSAQ